MLFLLSLLVYGLVVGMVAKLLHPGEDPVGFLPTIGIGLAGSYVGGFLNWLLFGGAEPFTMSGIVMGVIGGVIFCWLYRKYRLERFFQAQGRYPGSLIHKK